MMNLQVQPLKLLATREVVTKRLDYSTYLNGTTKDELDGLGRLAGNYKIHASKTTIEAVSNELDEGQGVVFESSRGPISDLEHFKEIFEGILRTDLISFIEGTKYFSIVESKTGPRKWVISDVDGVDKVWLTGRGDLKQESSFWGRHDHFIEDGMLVTLYERYNEKMEKILTVRDNIATDKQGNVIREFIWTQANGMQCECNTYCYLNAEFKITKVMWAQREPAHRCTIS